MEQVPGSGPTAAEKSSVLLLSVVTLSPRSGPVKALMVAIAAAVLGGTAMRSHKHSAVGPQASPVANGTLPFTSSETSEPGVLGPPVSSR